MPKTLVDKKTVHQGRPLKWTKARASRAATSLWKYALEHENDLLIVSAWLKEETLYRELLPVLSERSPAFDHTLKRVRSMEEHNLAQSLLSDPQKVTSRIFALKNIAKWRDKSPEEAKDLAAKVKITTVESKKLTDEELRDRVDKALSGVQQEPNLKLAKGGK